MYDILSKHLVLIVVDKFVRWWNNSVYDTAYIKYMHLPANSSIYIGTLCGWLGLLQLNTAHARRAPHRKAVACWRRGTGAQPHAARRERQTGGPGSRNTSAGGDVLCHHPALVPSVYLLGDLRTNAAARLPLGVFCAPRHGRRRG